MTGLGFTGRDDSSKEEEDKKSPPARLLPILELSYSGNSKGKSRTPVGRLQRSRNFY